MNYFNNPKSILFKSTLNLFKLFCLLVLSTVLCCSYSNSLAQTAQYDFNTTATLTTATVGSNAISVGTNVTSTNGLAGVQNITLTIAGAPYKQNNIYMEWDYVSKENDANFFELDDLEITMSGRNISIQYRNTAAGSVKSYTNVTSLANTNPSTVYALSFSYDASTGIAELKNGSTSLWTTPLADRGANNLVWSSSTTNAVIGSRMDGRGAGTLDAFRIWANTHLPVEFISLNAEQVNEKVTVQWSTASELNNEIFVVQRSYDGVDFQNIGTVAGAGNSNQILEYEFIDELVNISKRTVFYRIKQIDYDGTADFSEVVKLNFDGETLPVRLYPNPVTSREATIEGWHLGIETKLYDQYGRLILSSELDRLNLDNVANGAYEAVFYDKNIRSRSSQKLIVQ